MPLFKQGTRCIIILQKTDTPTLLGFIVAMLYGSISIFSISRLPCSAASANGRFPDWNTDRECRCRQEHMVDVKRKLQIGLKCQDFVTKYENQSHTTFLKCFHNKSFTVCIMQLVQNDLNIKVAKTWLHTCSQP